TFGVRANIPWHERDKTGVLRSEGWINFFKKDMQAKLKVENIDGIYLEPYYNNYVDFEQARIQDATLRFHCTIHGLANDATVRGEFELMDIVRVPRPEDEYRQPAERLTDTLLVLFQSLDEEGKMKLPIEYDTKLDQPEFGFGIFKAAFVDTVMVARDRRAIKPERVLGFPGKLMTGVFKGVGDLTRAVVVGSVSVADGVRQGVTASFKKGAPPEDSDSPE
ncbi:MAG: hypothetical protein MJA29_08655, partial [Candidatus Omnitrophica bacterium]|nr:hypothetical protein [Candidatus Omnitrophota bacterium]